MKAFDWSQNSVQSCQLLTLAWLAVNNPTYKEDIKCAMREMGKVKRTEFRTSRNGFILEHARYRNKRTYH